MRWMILCGTLTACATGGESSSPAAGEWDHAVAIGECAPWDGAATTVYLTEVPYSDQLPRPYLRLAVYHGINEVAGQRWDVGAGHEQDGLPSLCPAGGACVNARSGWIAFGARSAEDPLEGSYDITFENGQRLAGGFSAPVLERLALCG
ncbi:MAG: hypothetical protein OEW17_07790 [Gemmatimonadota bacterium]|nr:hypothetical protein [Gemmatimonadota bacterium]MDH4348693.1 hypothetical protein [Gemmatimonadota bacterium]MDH5283550.1 hypothetical protein [Gemmatimonadota bacterium]